MIIITNRQSRHKVSPRRFKVLLEKLARRYRLRDPEVSLSFVGPERIRDLNRRYLKKNAPTDVLSFPLGEKAADGKYYLGDIVIAPEKAWRQSREKGHSLEQEMEILTVHGFLHLLGHDHSARMEKEEAGIYRTLWRASRRKPATRRISPPGASPERRTKPKLSVQQKLGMGVLTRPKP